MATNATFTWIPQSNIVAQEVWYGALSAVGSTLPPAAGWNPGANLYSATANSATLNNLNENTQYQFAVLTHCTTGQSSWGMLTGYKLVCPTVSAVPTSTSVAVTLSTLYPAPLSAIINTLTIALVQVSNGGTVSTANYSGVNILGTLTNTFTGLTVSTAYNVVVSYTLTSGGSSTICSTTAVSTAAAQTCPVISFSISNVNTTGFTVTPAGLQSGDTYDVSINGGTSFAYINATQPSFAIPSLSSGTTYTVVVRRDCANSLTSVTPSQQVTTTVNNFVVTDVWYMCSGGGANCNGQAVWCSVASVRATNTGVVLYNYTNNPSIPNGFGGFINGLVVGTEYTLTATWVINGSKTQGISAVFLGANGATQNWSTSQATITESITFVAESTTTIQVQCSSRGSLCQPFC